MTAAAVGQGDSIRTEVDYIDGPACKLFVTRFLPPTQIDAGQAVLCLPPFAEEMNKSRRMLALQGRALASRGVSFILPDVRGTGDSEGVFGDAPWEAWCDDLRSILEWLCVEKFAQLDVLALRSGVFLGLDMLASPDMGRRSLALWSPVTRGKAMLDQLFRTMLIRNTGSGSMNSVADIRERLTRDGGIETAGYWLSSDLLHSVDALDLSNVPAASGHRILWADVSPAMLDGVPRKTAKILQSWEAGHATVEYSRFVGPQFWMGPEIELVTALLEKTTEFFTAD